MRSRCGLSPKAYRLQESARGKFMGRELRSFADMTQILMRAERNVYGELCVKILSAHGRRLNIEQSDAARKVCRNEGAEMRRRIKRAQRLSEKALYGKETKFLAQSPTFDPAKPGMLDMIKAFQPLHAEKDPVSIIPPGDLPQNPHVSAEVFRPDIFAMDSDLETAPDRAGVCWLLIVSSTEQMFHPVLSGL